MSGNADTLHRLPRSRRARCLRHRLESLGTNNRSHFDRCGRSPSQAHRIHVAACTSHFGGVLGSVAILIREVNRTATCSPRSEAASVTRLFSDPSESNLQAPKIHSVDLAEEHLKQGLCVVQDGSQEEPCCTANRPKAWSVFSSSGTWVANLYTRPGLKGHFRCGTVL